MTITAIFYLASNIIYNDKNRFHGQYNTKNETLYSFNDPNQAFTYLKELDSYQPLPADIINTATDSQNRIELDNNYCDLVRTNFVHNTNELMFKKKIVIDYPNTGTLGKSLQFITENVHSLIGSKQKLPYDTTFFFTHFILHRNLHFEKNFGCLNQMHNHIYDNAIFNTKSLTAQAYLNYIMKYQNRTQCIDQFMPDSYLLANKTQCIEFFNLLHTEDYKEEKKKRGIIFFSKIASGVHRSKGVDIVDEEHEKDLTRDYENGLKCGKNTKNIQIQKYVPDLLLLQGHKFDFRVYLLIASTNPVIAYYHDGFLKLSVHPFELNSSNKEVHISNTHIAERAFRKARASSWLGMNETELRNFQTWNFDRLQSYLLDKGYTNDKNWVDNNLRKQLKTIMIHVVKMTQHHFSKRSQLFELYGCDFVLDNKLKVWFIEPNTTPSFSGSSSDREKILMKMIIDMFELMHGYLKSRLKRVIQYINNLPKLESNQIPQDSYYDIKAKFEVANKNNMEIEFMPTNNNGFQKIVDENLEGIERYLDIFSKECAF